MVDILSQQQNAVGFDTPAENMETDTIEAEQKPEDSKEDLDEGELPEEGEITDEDEPAPVVETHKSQPRSRERNSSSHHRSHHSPPHRSSRPKAPPKSSKLSSKYKDFDGKATKQAAKEDVVMESWLNVVENKRRASPIYDSNEEYYGSTKPEGEQSSNENAIQAELMDEYGDVDYRQQIDETQKRGRRRSASPIDGFGTMAKRPRNDADEPQFPLPRRGPIRTKWTEKTLCKFFREGYCRDSENCAYSHNAADSHRRPELCRFYSQGYCKRGMACPNLHGEYPCKAFNKGECSKEQCNFSHQPLNEYTTPIFEQMMRDDELALKLLSHAGIKPRRRILLSDGPEEWDEYFPDETITESRVAMPQPSVVVPTLSNGSQPKAANPPQTNVPATATSSSYGFFNAVPSSHAATTRPSNYPNTSPHQSSQPPIQSNAPSKMMSPPQNEPFNFNDVLNFGASSAPKTATKSSGLSDSLIQDSLQSLQSMFDTGIVDESPKSPPMSGIVVSDSAPVIPTTRTYTAYPLLIPDTSGNLDLNLIQQLTSGIYKNNDPRMKRLAEKQFELVSKTFEQEGVALLNQQKPSIALPAVSRQQQQVIPPLHPPSTFPTTSAKPADPRARDPRTRAAAPVIDSSPYPTISTEADDFQSKIAQQLEMVAKQANTMKPDDLDMRASSAAHYDNAPYESHYERRRDSQPSTYRGHHPRSRGGPRGRFRHGDEHSKRHAHGNWNESPSDSPKLSPPARTSAESTPKDDQTNTAPLTMRQRFKNNEFESPLSSSGRRF
ncbi:hypothetical protein M3Y97_00761100 [Aphelenchoides bicaudatus]|nr:hypothetical protein M3Y97_00761100 [Aphelenchoides bicaudatus]